MNLPVKTGLRPTIRRCVSQATDLATGKAGIRVKHRIYSVEEDCGAPAVVLDAEEAAIMVAHIPIQAARGEHVLTRAPPDFIEMDCARNVAISGSWWTVWI